MTLDEFRFTAKFLSSSTQEKRLAAVTTNSRQIEIHYLFDVMDSLHRMLLAPLFQLSPSLTAKESLKKLEAIFT